MRFHKSNLGYAGEDLPCDYDGYCYTTIKEYMRYCGMDREEARDAVEAVKEAQEDLESWQNESVEVSTSKIRQIIKEELLKLLGEGKESDEEEEKDEEDSNIMISSTATQKGFGSDQWKHVTQLSKKEREHVKNGGIVIFKSSAKSGGNNGTYWRMVKYNSNTGFYPRVPSKDILDRAGVKY